MARWILFPAFVMSLGWGLRGFIGGGPLGAMIPGALVALVLCILIDRDDLDCGRIAAFGAVGVGLGGQMTYGQTIGLSFLTETHWWGLLGLTLKGAIWGLSGGALIGCALSRERFANRDMLIALGAMFAATFTGWKLINEPKLIYFSNPHDKPRPEIWAGLLLGAIALLIALSLPRVPVRFALWSMLGGGFGFGFGAWIQVMGRVWTSTPIVGWWKVMELTFGFCFGAALGWSAWKCQRDLATRTPFDAGEPLGIPRQVIRGALVVAAGLLLHQTPMRAAYSLTAVVLLALALYSAELGWQVAITMTYCAFSIDYLRSRPASEHQVLWILIVATTLLVAWLVARWGRVRPLFLLLLWTSVANSVCKSFSIGVTWRGQGFTELLFIAFAIAGMWFMGRRALPGLAAAGLLLGQTLAPAQWTRPLKEPVAGPPVVLSGGVIAVTLASGRIAILDAQGAPLGEAKMDLPAGGPVAPGNGPCHFYSADVWSSVYCWDRSGKRVWKAARQDKFGPPAYTWLIPADLDGDNVEEVLLGNARGNLLAIDARGRLRLEVHVTDYRVSTPAIGDTDGDGQVEIVFGTDDGDVICVTPRGEVRWRRRLEGGRFGRALPVIADADGDNRAEVYVSTPFVGAGPGLYSLDARTGEVRWKSPSTLQSYNSITIADLDGDGHNEILHGDKNTRLYAVSPAGKMRWDTQLDGRGIFYAPALVKTPAGVQIIQIVRGPGVNGKSLYALDPRGRVVDSIAIDNPSPWPPVLLTAPDGLRLITAGANGDVRAHPLPRGAEPVAPLMAKRTGARLPTQPHMSGEGREAKPGPNLITDAYDLLIVRDPDGAVHAEIALEGVQRRAEFIASTPGTYSVSLYRALAVKRYIYTLQPGLQPKPAPRGGLRARQVNPWPNLDVAPHTNAPENRLELAMLGNEVESAALAVTNLGDASVSVRAQGSVPGLFEFHEAPPVRVVSTGGLTEDVLPRLAAGNLLRLAPGETRKLWITVRSRDLKSGKHAAKILLGDIASTDAPIEVEAAVTVHPVRLPETRTYRHNVWLYLAGIRDPRAREATFLDAIDHGVNVFPTPPVTYQVDAHGRIAEARAQAHDALAKLVNKSGLLLITGSVGIAWPNGARRTPELDAKAHAAALRAYVEHTKSLGLDYSDWAFYTMDEPGLMGKDAAFDRWADEIRRIRAVDPRIQIYANPAGGARAEILKPVANLADIWQPDLHLVREQPAALGAIFGKGQYWHYEACADQRNLDPLGYYRMKPWVAFQMGMTGGGYWVHGSASYWFFDRSMGTEYGATYLTDDGPVTTKRWEASRDGIEDFELLSLARRSGGPEVRRLVDEAVAWVTNGQEKMSDIARQVRPIAPDYDRWMKLRSGIIHALAKNSL